jgi:putative phosphoesterase
MKLFLVMGDSHGDVRTLKRIVSEYGYIRSIIHLGDHYRDAAILRSCCPELEIFAVHGNCDGTYPAEMSETVLEAEGMRIFLTHGNRYGVKSGLERLKRKAALEKYDVVVYGHTHIPSIEKSSGCLFLNPGSAGYPRGGYRSTYALLEIGNGKAEARIMEVV